MDAQSLVQLLSVQELTYEAPALMVWEIGAASNEDEVAKFMYRGGPYPPMASTKPPRGDDLRPEKKYWKIVKTEMNTFLCTDDERYRELWKRIDAFEKKTTHSIVRMVATFLGESIGTVADTLVSFVALCFYAVAKFGKETYCSYVRQH